LATSGPLRTTILGVVAANLDAAGWEKFRAQAQAEKNNLVRAELYQQLGTAHDENLAKQTLELALTDEPGATNSSQIIASVARTHPDLAFDFAIQNREKVEPLVDASGRSRYIPELAQRSGSRDIIAKLQDFAERYMTPQSRRPADKAIAAIKDKIRIRETRLPDISHWLEAHVK
jgi:aminopeptidase N